MAQPQLIDDQKLRSACAAALEKATRDGYRDAWVTKIVAFIEGFHASPPDERASIEFQRRMWDENPIAATGQGQIAVENAIQDAGLRKWIADGLGREYPEDANERRLQIVSLFDEIRERVFPRCPRQPWLKLFRVMAVAFPRDFTTIADRRKVTQLYRAMFDAVKTRPLLRHFEIRERLDRVLGPPEPTLAATVERMVLPWFLLSYVVMPAGEDSTEEGAGPSETRLVPLPASRRRRGITSLPGHFSTVLAILDFIEEGVGRQEVMDHLRTLLPGYKDSSLGVVLNGLVAELAVIRRDGERYMLTDRGEAFLESGGDPNELSDWLLTRVLGVDAAVVALRDGGPLSSAELTARIKACNPNWTTDYMPASIAKWLRVAGVIEEDDNRQLRLSPTGREWGARIHWQPENLEGDPQEGDAAPAADPEAAKMAVADGPLPLLPDVTQVITRIQARGTFADRIIRDLDAGLWSHPRRHFAVLTGLSGTGKTLLATSYAEAIGARTCMVAVRPGWYDSTALLGYVNPLRPEAYVRTPFLEFLLSAAGEPMRPYVVILDEMNLSHPEHYLAPVLSAMESGAAVELHREGPDLDGIPQSTPYPSNLVLMGTVNMDETTHGLSDKVLDRAFTIEFWDVDVEAFPGWGTDGLPAVELQTARTVVAELYEALRPARLHFGWRTIGDVLGFLSRAATGADASEATRALDAIVYAKVLPKLRGDDSPRFRAAIDGAKKAAERHGLARTREKLEELQRDLEETGTARFWR